MIIYYSEDFDGRAESSRMLLFEAIAAYTEDEEKAGPLMAKLKRSESGKPYIEGFSPFSVSHSGSVWAVAFDERACGIDIQFAKECDMISIAARIFDPKDFETVEKASSESEAMARDAFFGIWTRREAFVKAFGGTVFDSSLPAVSAGAASKDGRMYYARDILWPGANRPYAAVCTEGSEVAEDEIRIIRLR